MARLTPYSTGRGATVVAALALMLCWPVAAAAAPSAADTASGQSTPDAKPERRWVRHRVVPGERLDQIAVRYGVTKKGIIRWNKKLQKKAWIYAGQKLRIYAKRFPPPPVKVSYRVERGDTWAKIASAHGVTVKALRFWNKKVPRAFKAGQKLVVWANPPEPPPEEEAGAGGSSNGDGWPTVSIRSGGYAVGKPNRGRLVNGVQLPKSDDYTVRDPNKAWATSHTATQLTRAIGKFRHDSGFQGQLVIGAISRRGGGRFRPHRSHQNGRDVDIRLPKRAGVGRNPKASDLDWARAWTLIRALVATGEVEYIFLDYQRQRRLHAAAKGAGASREELGRLIQYPRGPKANKGAVRHAKGHLIHIHVRFKCGDASPSCKSL